jgi:hypothetical protein
MIKENTVENLNVSPAFANEMLAEALVHFGATEYKPELVQPVKNENWVKPKGGLWTSPVNSEWGWKHWCEAENFRDCNEENSFKLLLNFDAKVFIIDSLNDLKNAPLVDYKIGSSYKKMYLDFETLAKTYDAIWLTEKGQSQTHLSRPINLYGWDCESVLIMNPYCCSEVSYGFC